MQGTYSLDLSITAIVQGRIRSALCLHNIALRKIGDDAFKKEPKWFPQDNCLPCSTSLVDLFTWYPI